MFGSEDYVRIHAAELHDIIAVFNADVIGLAAPLVLMVQNSPQLAGYLNGLPVDELDIRIVDDRLVPYSDHFPFTLDGVPSLMAVTSSPGQGHGWAHTSADTLDKIALRTLRQAVASAARVLLRMATEPAKLASKRQPPEQIKQVLADAGWEQPLRLQGRWPF
jgi:Zn-dependent M28 family amino/carboxypeptidase